MIERNDIWKTVEHPGYVSYFYGRPDEAQWVTENYAYSYDKDLVSEEEAFDPDALFNKDGAANQFHNVA